jgi:NAD(P)-dependent dehydrogenase (short-subunit alcohol dehydrogenase family)
MAFELENRHVVITGGVGGLGPTVVQAFVDAGARCHLPVREETGLPARPGVEVVTNVDLTDEQSVSGFFGRLPPIYASIHLAGGFRAGPITETTRADLEQQIAINLVTAFLCCREAVKSLQKAGGGRIVNVGSRASEVPSGGSTGYTAAKAAVAGFTRALAEEVKNDGILVNAVLPSIIDTPANRAAMPKADHARWPKPAEVARTIVWLASPENQLTTGALIPVYGRV